MDHAQFKEIMDAISKLRSDLEVKIHDLKKDVHTVQEIVRPSTKDKPEQLSI